MPLKGKPCFSGFICVLFVAWIMYGVFGEKEDTEPQILDGPSNATVFVDSSHFFTCQVSGHPRPVIRWQKKDNDSGRWKEIKSSKRTPLKNYRMNFQRILPIDAGQYRCTVGNVKGTAYSAIAYLTVNAKATIVEGPRNQTVNWGAEVRLSCEVVGIPLPLRSWYRDGVAVTDEATQKAVTGPFLTVNATETTKYECRAENKHFQGVTRVNMTAYITVIDGTCAPYNRTTCSSVHPLSKKVFTKLSDLDYSSSMESLLEGAFSSMDENVTGVCRKSAVVAFCNVAFPLCDETVVHAKPLPLCRESCMAVKDLLCSEWWTASGVPSFFDCQELPGRDTGECRFVDFFPISPGNATTTCYKGSGSGYAGSHSTTVSGFDCQMWQEKGLHLSAFPMLEMNFCRNPGSLRKQPWCFTAGNSIGWEYCDISACGDQTSDNLKSDESLLPEYILAVVVGVAIPFCVVAIIFFCRRYRQVRRRTVPPAPSPDNEKLMTELQQLPTVEVVPPSTAQQGLFAKYEFDRNSVVHVSDVAVGAFGPVFKARLKSRTNSVLDSSVSECNAHDSEKQYVAIKMLREGTDETIRHEFIRQASIIAHFDHQNIIRLIGVCFVGSPLCIALEFMAKGDLCAFLPSFKPDHYIFSPKYYIRQLLIAQQLVSILEHLERLRFLHRDLAARNFLVSSENYTEDAPLVKLADFGLAVKLDPGEDLHIGLETEAIAVRWTAPESIKQGHFSFASDVWSFGVLLWEVFSYGDHPYNFTQSLDDVSRHVLSGGQLETPCPEHPEIYELMRKCWIIQPGMRCSAAYLSASLSSILGNIRNSLNS